MNPKDSQSAYESVMVSNIDLGCADTSVDIVKVSNRIQDDEGNLSTQIFDKHEEWSHAEFFRVKFDGKPYEIAPGKTKLFPRFVAEHFAKHLADHLLQKKEDQTGRKGLVQSAVERPKVLSQILVEVNNDIVTTPEPNPAVTPAPEAQEPRMEQVDTGAIEDAGVVPNIAVGDLKPEPPTLAELLKVAGEDPDKIDRIPIEETSISDDKKPLPTRKQLIELCYQQSIDITGMENKAELIEKLKRG